MLPFAGPSQGHSNPAWDGGPIYWHNNLSGTGPGWCLQPGLPSQTPGRLGQRCWSVSEVTWPPNLEFRRWGSLAGPVRSWITELAGISGLGPNSEPRGNNRSFPETRARAPVKKIGSRDSIFGLVISTYFFKITNHNQHAFNIKYLANLIKKYWTCFRCQKLADFLVCFPPSVRVQVRRPPSWKICLRIKLSFGFWGRAVKAFDNFSRKLTWLLKTIF